MIKRRISREVRIGPLVIGGHNPVLVQSMTDTMTSDSSSTIEQCKQLFDAGAGMVRIATPAIRDAKLLREIRQRLNETGYTGPLAADVHFNSLVAEMAASYAEKVRINPGNFIQDNDTEHEYASQMRIEEKLRPLVLLCKRKQVALRIGVNHGSLSERILQKFGDTPEGMSESVMEYLRLLDALEFDQVVVSIKSSNPTIMVKANRLLWEKMQQEERSYPFHLGLTEAGEALEARIKSAMAIGTLLYDGIGDTIRVSLTEPPENEIPVAREILRFIREMKPFPVGNLTEQPPVQIDCSRLHSLSGHTFPVVISDFSEDTPSDPQPDFMCCKSRQTEDLSFEKHKTILPYDHPSFKNDIHLPVYDAHQIDKTLLNPDTKFILLRPEEITMKLVRSLKKIHHFILILEIRQEDVSGYIKNIVSILQMNQLNIPVILRIMSTESDLMKYQVQTAIQTGPLLLDTIPWIQGLWLSNPAAGRMNTDMAFAILQAAGKRITKAEFISCPGCGRTLFNLQETNRKIKDSLGHLTGLKIAVMGCLVNGPGEMADADVGYVGAGPGKINLFQKKELIEKNISEDEALPAMIALLKRNSWWKEP